MCWSFGFSIIVPAHTLPHSDKSIVYSELNSDWWIVILTCVTSSCWGRECSSQFLASLRVCLSSCCCIGGLLPVGFIGAPWPATQRDSNVLYLHGNRSAAEITRRFFYSIILVWFWWLFIIYSAAAKFVPSVSIAELLYDE